MARKLKRSKPLIYVFCEGESEQAYTDFLKKQFEEVAVIKKPKATGVFEEAEVRFQKDPSYRNNADVTDEIWFFFDVEKKDVARWDERLKIMKRLRKLRKDQAIKVRLLMTTACIEYWFILHYKMFHPPIETVANKENMLKEVLKYEPTYKKGDLDSTSRIAINYPNAVANAAKTLKSLLDEGLPGLEDTDERNHWLYCNCKTFSTVQEAIMYLENLKEA